MTNLAYFSVPALTEEQFNEVNESHDAIKTLRKFIPTAEGYSSVFAYNGQLYHTDTNYDSQVRDCKLDKLHHTASFTPVTELPTETIVKEVVAPHHYSEALLLKLVNSASHPFLHNS